ncbi:hypothetical protein ACLKA7_004436 [Drosophila subpalustris]
MTRRNIIRWGPQQQQPKWISELGLWESLRHWHWEKFSPVLVISLAPTSRNAFAGLKQLQVASVQQPESESHP